jgi:L-threonylcarbamoyladenylate synthase
VNRAVDLAHLRSGERTALVAAIAAAGLVCFPTDTVYGIGGVVSPATGRAITRAKGRRADRPLQVVYPTLELLLAGVALSPAVADAARRLLPGPFTLVVPYPDGVTFPPFGLVAWPAADGAGGGPDDGGEGSPREGGPGGGAAPTVVRTLGVRVPAWPPAARALARLPFPLLASSANPSGEHDPVGLSDVAPGVRAACDLLLDAGPTSGVSSTVLDLSGLQAGRGFRVLRPGAVGSAEIAAILAS